MSEALTKSSVASVPPQPPRPRSVSCTALPRAASQRVHGREMHYYLNLSRPLLFAHALSRNRAPRSLDLAEVSRIRTSHSN